MIKLYVIFVLFFTCCLICVTSSENQFKITQIDLIIQDLEKQDWLEDETTCISDTLHILNNVKNHTLWAVWIWNSMQHPTGTFYGSRYSLGNYDQCIKAPGYYQVLTQYCLVDVKLTGDDEKKEGKVNPFSETDDFLKMKSHIGRIYNIITWGTCLPATCNAHSITKILRTLYAINPLAAAEPQFSISDCQIAKDTPKLSFQFYLFIAVMLSLVCTAITSTVYLQYTKEDTRLSRIAYSFSLKRNWLSFIKTSADEISILNFMKTFHLVFTTCSHSIVYALMGAMSNGATFDEAAAVNENIMGNLLHHIDLPTVENFFLISGFLVMKSLMEKKKSPIVSLIQRYIRLIGSLTVLVFFTTAVFKYTGDGPLWNKMTGRELKACEDNWFWGLLMVNNYVNNEGICQLVTWYVPCDYHLAIMGTALFCIWQWNRRLGKITTILAVILSVLMPGAVTYWNRYPGIMFYDVEKITDVRTNVVFLDTYIKSHNRAGSYLLGMAMAYILMTYRPDNYRGVISRTWSYICLTLSGIIALRVWVSAGVWCLLEYNAWDSAVYAALNRNIWAITTCVCIFIMSYGNIPEIQNIIAWPGFAITSRLAYGVYITHSVILQRTVFSRRNPMQYDFFDMIVNGLGVLVASSLIAVLLWLFVEAPLSNLTNLILLPRKQAVNGIKKEQQANGYTVTSELKNGKDC